MLPHAPTAPALRIDAAGAAASPGREVVQSPRTRAWLRARGLGGDIPSRAPHRRWSGSYGAHDASAASSRAGSPLASPQASPAPPGQHGTPRRPNDRFLPSTRAVAAAGEAAALAGALATVASAGGQSHTWSAFTTGDGYRSSRRGSLASQSRPPSVGRQRQDRLTWSRPLVTTAGRGGGNNRHRAVDDRAPKADARRDPVSVQHVDSQLQELHRRHPHLARAIKHRPATRERARLKLKPSMSDASYHSFVSLFSKDSATDDDQDAASSRTSSFVAAGAGPGSGDMSGVLLPVATSGAAAAMSRAQAVLARASGRPVPQDHAIALSTSANVTDPAHMDAGDGAPVDSDDGYGGDDDNTEAEVGADGRRLPRSPLKWAALLSTPARTSMMRSGLLSHGGTVHAALHGDVDAEGVSEATAAPGSAGGRSAHTAHTRGATHRSRPAALALSSGGDQTAASVPTAVGAAVSALQQGAGVDSSATRARNMFRRWKQAAAASSHVMLPHITMSPARALARANFYGSMRRWNDITHTTVTDLDQVFEAEEAAQRQVAEAAARAAAEAAAVEAASAARERASMEAEEAATRRLNAARAALTVDINAGQSQASDDSGRRRRRLSPRRRISVRSRWHKAVKLALASKSDAGAKAHKRGRRHVKRLSVSSVSSGGSVSLHDPMPPSPRAGITAATWRRRVAKLVESGATVTPEAIAAIGRVGSMSSMDSAVDTAGNGAAASTHNVSASDTDTGYDSVTSNTTGSPRALGRVSHDTSPRSAASGSPRALLRAKSMTSSPRSAASGSPRAYLLRAHSAVVKGASSPLSAGSRSPRASDTPRAQGESGSEASPRAFKARGGGGGVSGSPTSLAHNDDVAAAMDAVVYGKLGAQHRQRSWSKETGVSGGSGGSTTDGSTFAGVVARLMRGSARQRTVSNTSTLSGASSGSNSAPVAPSDGTASDTSPTKASPQAPVARAKAAAASDGQEPEPTRPPGKRRTSSQLSMVQQSLGVDMAALLSPRSRALLGTHMPSRLAPKRFFFGEGDGADSEEAEASKKPKPWLAPGFKLPSPVITEPDTAEGGAVPETISPRGAMHFASLFATPAASLESSPAAGAVPGSRSPRVPITPVFAGSPLRAAVSARDAPIKSALKQAPDAVVQRTSSERVPRVRWHGANALDASTRAVDKYTQRVARWTEPSDEPRAQAGTRVRVEYDLDGKRVRPSRAATTKPHASRSAAGKVLRKVLSTRRSRTARGSRAPARTASRTAQGHESVVLAASEKLRSAIASTRSAIAMFSSGGVVDDTTKPGAVAALRPSPPTSRGASSVSAVTRSRAWGSPRGTPSPRTRALQRRGSQGRQRTRSLGTDVQSDAPTTPRSALQLLRGERSVTSDVGAATTPAPGSLGDASSGASGEWPTDVADASTAFGTGLNTVWERDRGNSRASGASTTGDTRLGTTVAGSVGLASAAVGANDSTGTMKSAQSGGSAGTDVDGTAAAPPAKSGPVDDRAFAARLQTWILAKRHSARQMSLRMEEESRMEGEQVLRRIHGHDSGDTRGARGRDRAAQGEPQSPRGTGGQASSPAATTGAATSALGLRRHGTSSALLSNGSPSQDAARGESPTRARERRRSSAARSTDPRSRSSSETSRDSTSGRRPRTQFNVVRLGDDGYFQRCKEMGIAPEALGCALDPSFSGSTIVDLSNYGMGNKVAHAVSASLPNLLTLRTLILSGNRFKDSGLTSIFGALPRTLRVLDVSNNVMGVEACTQLAQVMGRHSFNVSELNLSNMKISDRHAAMLFRAVSPVGHRARRVLTVLDLSRNHVGVRGARALAGFMSGECRLLRLSLAWNHLRSAAAKEIAQGIGVNNSLHTLDLSWNGFGGTDAGPNSSAVALARALFTNNVLVHVNLSHNHLSERECAVLAEAIKYNHSLLGVHMTGNAGEVDIAGFIIPVAHHHHTHDNEHGDDDMVMYVAAMSTALVPGSGTPATATRGVAAGSTSIAMPRRPNTTAVGHRTSGSSSPQPDSGTSTRPATAEVGPTRRSALDQRQHAAATNRGVGELSSRVMARSHTRTAAAHVHQASLYGRRKHRLAAGDEHTLGIATFDHNGEKVNCWVCQPWREVRIAVAVPYATLAQFPAATRRSRSHQVSPAHSRRGSPRRAGSPLGRHVTDVDPDDYLVRMHASFDAWKACEMKPAAAHGVGGMSNVSPSRRGEAEFFVFRMVPPGEHRFVITINGQPYCDPTQPMVPLRAGLQLRYRVHKPDHSVMELVMGLGQRPGAKSSGRQEASGRGGTGGGNGAVQRAKPAIVAMTGANRLRQGSRASPSPVKAGAQARRARGQRVMVSLGSKSSGGVGKGKGKGKGKRRRKKKKPAPIAVPTAEQQLREPLRLPGMLLSQAAMSPRSRVVKVLTPNSQGPTSGLFSPVVGVKSRSPGSPPVPGLLRAMWSSPSRSAPTSPQPPDADVGLTHINVLQVEERDPSQRMRYLRATNLRSVVRAKPPGAAMTAFTKHRKTGPWRLEDSVFANFKGEFAWRLKDAFNADWRRSRLRQLRIVRDKDELALVKACLRNHYPAIIHIFGWYSTVNSNLLGMSMLSYTQLVQTCEIQDQAACNTTALDNIFVAANNNTAQNVSFNTHKLLVRHELLELFVRLAIAKFRVDPASRARVLHAKATNARRGSSRHLNKTGRAGSISRIARLTPGGSSRSISSASPHPGSPAVGSVGSPHPGGSALMAKGAPTSFPAALAMASARLLGPVARARRRLSIAEGSSQSMSSVDPDKISRVFSSWSVSEVLEVLMDQYVLPNAERLNTGKWRTCVLHTEVVAQVFDEFLPLVRRLFDRYASPKRPSTAPLMTTEEFLTFCQENHLQTRLVTHRELKLAFNWSRGLQIDELTQEFPLCLDFDEFIHALAMIADLHTDSPSLCAKDFGRVALQGMDENEANIARQRQREQRKSNWGGSTSAVTASQRLARGHGSKGKHGSKGTVNSSTQSIRSNASRQSHHSKRSARSARSSRSRSRASVKSRSSSRLSRHSSAASLRAHSPIQSAAELARAASHGSANDGAGAEGVAKHAGKSSPTALSLPVLVATPPSTDGPDSPRKPTPRTPRSNDDAQPQPPLQPSALPSVVDPTPALGSGGGEVEAKAAEGGDTPAAPITAKPGQSLYEGMHTIGSAGLCMVQLHATAVGGSAGVGVEPAVNGVTVTAMPVAGSATKLGHQLRGVRRGASGSSKLGVGGDSPPKLLQMKLGPDLHGAVALDVLRMAWDARRLWVLHGLGTTGAGKTMTLRVVTRAPAPAPSRPTASPTRQPRPVSSKQAAQVASAPRDVLLFSGWKQVDGGCCAVSIYARGLGAGASDTGQVSVPPSLQAWRHLGGRVCKRVPTPVADADALLPDSVVLTIVATRVRDGSALPSLVLSLTNPYDAGIVRRLATSTTTELADFVRDDLGAMETRTGHPELMVRTDEADVLAGLDSEPTHSSAGASSALVVARGASSTPAISSPLRHESRSPSPAPHNSTQSLRAKLSQSQQSGAGTGSGPALPTVAVPPAAPQPWGDKPPRSHASMVMALADSLRTVLELCRAVERDRTHKRLKRGDTAALFRRIASLSNALGGAHGKTEGTGDSDQSANGDEKGPDEKPSPGGKRSLLPDIQESPAGSVGSLSVDSADDLRDRQRTLFGTADETPSSGSSPKPRPSHVSHAASPVGTGGRWSKQAAASRRALTRQRSLRAWAAIRSVVLLRSSWRKPEPKATKPHAGQ